MEDFDFYPPKPELIEPKAKGSLALTIFSIVLFVMTFLFVFTDEVNFVFHLLIVLLVHELGHFAIMKLFKYDNVRMLFIPMMGAFVQGSKEEYSQKQSLLVVGAGPFPGVIIGSLLIILASKYQEAWLVDLGLLFLFLNIINLVPLDPLDGGQLFKLLIRKNHELFTLIFSFVSSLILIAFGWYLDSWVMMIFGFLMGFRVRSIQNQYYLRKELKEEEVNYQTTYKSLSNRDFSKIKEVLLEHTPALRSYIDQIAPEEADPLMASQVNNVLVSPINRDASVYFKFIVIAFWITSLLSPFVLFFIFFDTFRDNFGWYLEILSNQ
ncbi:MAG: site-2 protease family protein [Flavobacteriales bacterium]|jgi:stage IV sporulation protein FB